MAKKELEAWKGLLSQCSLDHFENACIQVRKTSSILNNLPNTNAQLLYKKPTSVLQVYAIPYFYQFLLQIQTVFDEYSILVLPEKVKLNYVEQLFSSDRKPLSEPGIRSLQKLFELIGLSFEPVVMYSLNPSQVNPISKEILQLINQLPHDYIVDLSINMNESTYQCGRNLKSLNANVDVESILNWLLTRPYFTRIQLMNQSKEMQNESSIETDSMDSLEEFEDQETIEENEVSNEMVMDNDFYDEIFNKP